MFVKCLLNRRALQGFISSTSLGEIVPAIDAHPVTGNVHPENVYQVFVPLVSGVTENVQQVLLKMFIRCY